VIPESRLLVFSAVDETALAGRVEALKEVLGGRRDELADIGFTLATSRRAFAHRAAWVLPALSPDEPDPADAIAAVRFEQLDRGVAKGAAADVAMMFPGQGSQFIGMGRELYASHARFKEIVDRCDELAAPKLGLSLRELLFHGERGESQDAKTLAQTAIAQPALFAVEYALAEVLRGYGVVPSIVIGHSIGEYAAACVAGVFEMEAALELVIERGRLMQSMPAGSMLAVRARPDAALGLLAGDPDLLSQISLAAHNAPELSVVSGPSHAIGHYARLATERGLESQTLHTSHAFHSSMMDPIVDEFARAVERTAPRAPGIPIVSGLTGKLLTPEQAASARYWADQLRQAVRFADGVQTLCDREERVLLEVGPGTALTTSAAKQTAGVRPRRMLETLGHPKLDRPALEATLRCLGRLWIEGVPVDWNAVYDAPSRRLVRLPTYRFTRSRHWLSVQRAASGAVSHETHTSVRTSVAASNGHTLIVRETTTTEVAPSVTPVEMARAQLASVLEARLGRSLAEGDLGRSFIEIGFDSLGLTQLSGKLNTTFGVRIPFRRFFEDLATPALLAELLAVESKKLVAPPAVPAPLAPKAITPPGEAAVSRASVAASAPPLGLGAGALAMAPASGLSGGGLSAGALSAAALSSPTLPAVGLPQPGLSAAALFNDVSVSALGERLDRIERALEALVRHSTPANGAAEHGNGFARHAALEARASSTPAPEAPSLPSDRFEPTSAQREIWIASSVGGPAATLAYNECRAIALRGAVAVDALAQALNELSERHEALRQTFSADGALCITAESRPLELQRVDLRELPEAVRREELAALEARQTSTPFDLTAGPLVRAQLVSLADDEHRLLICAHHIVVDGYSFGLLTRELGELYSARVEGRAHGLGAPESFARYAAGESAYEATPVARDDRAFWLEHLKGLSEDLTLPSDAARPPQRTYDSARRDFALDATLVAKLRELAASSSTSTQTLLMAAFQLLLYSVSRQSDLVLGVPTSGQAAVGADVLVGHCVHVLPVRTLLDPSASFAAHAKQLQSVMLECLEHQRTTFSDLLHDLNRPRDPSRIPLIPVAFGMGRSMKRPAFSGLETRLSVVPRVSESFELYVYLTEDRDGLEVSWSYNRNLFQADTIEQWQRCFSAILAGLVRAGTAQRLDEINVLDAFDRRRLLDFARGPQVSRAAHEAVSDRIAARGLAQPDRTAVIDHTGEHSYAALNARANQLGHLLRSRVSEPNGLVAICLDRSVELVAALLGVWRAGLGYVPLDPGYPSGRIEMILEDAGGPLVLTSRSLADRTPEGSRRVFIEDVSDELAQQPTSVPEVQRSPSDIAYVIFTSGSTGRPKGVVIQQGAFENFIVSMQREPGFGAKDCLLAITTISFDIAGLELFLPLFCGGSLVLATREQASDPRELAALLVRHPITVMQATPASWLMLFDSGWPGRPGLKVLCGGEAFPRHLAEKFIASSAEIWNVYGPTETTVWSTVKRITHAAEITIGKAIDNTTLYVLDERRALVPVGTSGELWIGGSGVARGYLGRDDLTAERFVPSPFDPNDRIYKTGDLARVRNDGEFECLGRADFQVKIRGFRIELGEIETAMLKHPGVASAVVVAREDRPGDKLLAGYVVPHPGATIDVEALRQGLQGQLPAYMLPSALCVLDALPMTPNNKVDRKALPPPVQTDGYVPPGDVVRKAPGELGLWQEVWVDTPLAGEAVAPLSWLVLVDEAGLGQKLAADLESRGHVVTRVHSRDRFHEHAEGDYSVNPEVGREDFDQLCRRLAELGRAPDRVVHLWSLDDGARPRPGSTSYHRNQEHGVYSLVHLATAHARHAAERAVVHHVVGSGLLFGDELSPDQRERATILGACRVIPNELARQQVRALDLEIKGGALTGRAGRALGARLLRELLEGDAQPEVRYRKGVRQVPAWRALRGPVPARQSVPQGSALVVGLTEVGLASARALARAAGVKVALVFERAERSQRPDAQGLAMTQGRAMLREALAELERTGAVTALQADLENPSELGPVLHRFQQQHGSLRTLVLAVPEAAPIALRDLTESEVEARVAAKVQRLLALERALPLSQIELSVMHTSLDARLGAPGHLAEAVASAFVEKRLQKSRGCHILCSTGPLAASAAGASSAPTTATTTPASATQVERDREHYRSYGLSTPELDAALASVLAAAGDAALALSPFELEAYRARLALSSAKDSGAGSKRLFIEPSTDTERQLARLWMEALRLDRVSARDSFFDLGGHSVLAARLFAKLHDVFGVVLPLAVLVEAPTLDALAARIDAAREQADAENDSARASGGTETSLLVRLNSGTEPQQAPLFVVAGAMGNVLNLRHLARICDPRRDFYGIQARGLSGDAEPHRTLEAAAEAYLEEVRRVQPRGPYYLGGFCIGGVAALEMARTLKDAGEEVRLLAMLDSHLPEVRGSLGVRDKAQIHIERFREEGTDYVREWARNKYAWELGRVRRQFGLSEDDTSDPAQYRSEFVHQAIMYARSVYQPRFYDGHIVLFRPPLAARHHLGGGRVIDRDRSFLREDNGWRRMVRSVEIHELAAPPGDHDGFVLEPYVRDLARRLRPLLP
jgi:amino acid adenylation domain-containing protein